MALALLANEKDATADPLVVLAMVATKITAPHRDRRTTTTTTTRTEMCLPSEHRLGESVDLESVRPEPYLLPPLQCLLLATVMETSRRRL